MNAIDHSLSKRRHGCIECIMRKKKMKRRRKVREREMERKRHDEGSEKCVFLIRHATPF